MPTRSLTITEAGAEEAGAEEAGEATEADTEVTTYFN
jgi:hypothetical protein